MKKSILSILLSFLATLCITACEPEDPIDDDVGLDCTTLPPVADYGQPGPFSDAKMFTRVGPNNNYTLFRPDGSLGQNGFKHPIATWGNGIMTTPQLYKDTLTLIASHGFVVIACNDIKAERACLANGLDWLIAQNESGDVMKGKLDVSRELTIGYSWGGGAAIDTADRPNVKATVSFHGMPPREKNSLSLMHSPLLLFTSTGDNFVDADQYVTPVFEDSTVQTFYATLDKNVSHLYILDLNGAAELERGPAIAWMRYWACDDQGAWDLFFGDECDLCVDPWIAQRKNWSQ